MVTVEDADGRKHVTVDKPFARVGSYEQSEIPLAGQDVARRRLYFHATNEGVYCVDLADAGEAGKLINGWLAPDQSIPLGRFKIWVQLADGIDLQDKHELDLTAKASVPEPFPRLVVFAEGRELGERRIDRRLTLLGRHEPCHVRISSRSVSNAHCVLYWEGGVLWVVDLLSGNGTLLDGRRIEVAQLSPENTLTLGRAEVRVRLSAAEGPGSCADRPVSAHTESDTRNLASSEELRLQLENERAALRSERETWQAERERWDSQRECWQRDISERVGALSEEAAQLAAKRAEFEMQCATSEAELRQRESDLAEGRVRLDEERQALAAEWERLHAPQAEQRQSEAALDASPDGAEGQCNQPPASSGESRSRLAGEGEFDDDPMSMLCDVLHRQEDGRVDGDRGRLVLWAVMVLVVVASAAAIATAFGLV